MTWCCPRTAMWQLLPPSGPLGAPCFLSHARTIPTGDNDQSEAAAVAELMDRDVTPQPAYEVTLMMQRMCRSHPLISHFGFGEGGGAVWDKF